MFFDELKHRQNNRRRDRRQNHVFEKRHDATDGRAARRAKLRRVSERQKPTGTFRAKTKHLFFQLGG
jgi:hypothetical protein